MFSSKRQRSDKIFINYRRDDSGGYAGRLADTLGAYFGAGRVFRDVTGIGYGDDFERVIDDRVRESCALVVLIGEQWTSIADESGRRRLDNPSDYVVREIAAALSGDVVVVPVLIGDATMPRREELPAALAELTRRNAMTITDERWGHDVERLARVLAIDVPGSVAQRRLDLMRSGALALAALTSILGIVAFSAAVSQLIPEGFALRDAGFSPLLSAVPFIGALLAGLLALVAVPLLEASKRKYALAAMAVAAAGTLAFFIHYSLVNEARPGWSLIVNFAGSMIVGVLLLVLIALASFRAR